MIQPGDPLVEPRVVASAQLGGMLVQFSVVESRRRKMSVAHMGRGAYAPGLARPAAQDGLASARQDKMTRALQEPVYYGESQKTSPFFPTLLPILAVSSLFEKAALRRSICPQIICGF